jgi:hypothetical protein
MAPDTVDSIDASRVSPPMRRSADRADAKVTILPTNGHLRRPGGDALHGVGTLGGCVAGSRTLIDYLE